MSSLGKSCIGSSEFGGQRKLRGSFWAGSARVLSRGRYIFLGIWGFVARDSGVVGGICGWCSQVGLALVFGVGLSVFWVPMGVVCMMGKEESGQRNV